jgi:hypothetical protein
MQKLGWTERGGSVRPAESYGIFSWGLDRRRPDWRPNGWSWPMDGRYHDDEAA